MSKILFSILIMSGCSIGMLAQTDDNALRINFTGTGCPIETEHALEGTHITFSEDGEKMNLTVNDATATYSLSNVSGMTHFNGTPSVSLHANEDPTKGQEGKFYTTFYSGLEAYTLPEGVKAYTATIAEEDGDKVVMLTAVEGDVLPQAEAVLLYTTEGSGITMAVADGTGVGITENNTFCGVDVDTEQYAPNYMLSYGQYGLGFYLMKEDMKLSANKAFIPKSYTGYAKALRMVFADDDVDAIQNVSTNEVNNRAIYNINGTRLNKLQKGIHIVGSKKVVKE